MGVETNQTVKVELKKEMGRIRDLWDYYFLEYKSLNDETWSPKNTSLKYVGTILGNFIDTFDVIYDYKIAANERFNYSANIGLMQAIYIQQDIMEDLLLIFRCDINKGQLKLDDNYNINRNIRNELVGHPIRRQGATLTSTTLIAYNGDKGSINYMRYHKDTGFQFEMISHSIEEIIERHTNFIRTYFGKIIAKINNLMKPFVKKLKEIEKVIDSIEFPKLLKLTDQRFESIYKQDFGYESLVEVYEKRNNHARYQHVIDSFKIDLKSSISDHIENIDEKFNPKEELETRFDVQLPVIEITKTNVDGIISVTIAGEDIPVGTANIQFKEREYEYYVTKLIDNRDLFKMCFTVLKENFPNNKLVHEELDNMAAHKNDDVEYYCSYRLIRRELDMDDD